jgi:nucleotide-binding universal stress UspA family protein
LERQTGAAIKVLDVLTPLQPGLVRWREGPPPEKIEQLVLENRQAELEELASSVASDASFTVEVRFGKPFVETTCAVLREGHDMVITATDEDRPRWRPLFGSRVLHLLRKCPAAVWVAKGEAGHGYRRIVAAVDPGPVRDEGANGGLDTTILQLATSMAQIDGAELHVVHAWSAFGEQLLAGRAKMSAADVAAYVAERRDAQQQWLDALLAASEVPGGPPRQPHLIKGDPAEVIPRFVRERQADLIVMGTVARTGIAGLLIGNTAEDILQAIDCSVLAVKPLGFVTPVSC